MKTFIALILSCVSAFAADTNIQFFATAKTNAETASIYTTEVFCRDSQTNLVRYSKIKNGKVQFRIQKFFHNGVVIGDYVAMKTSGFNIEAGIPYSVSFEFWPSKDVRSVVIGTRDGVILDAFTCTNGLFLPADSSFITKANNFNQDLSQLFSPSNFTNATSQEFQQKVEQFIQKHQENKK
jgi:hypothetical protein